MQYGFKIGKTQAIEEFYYITLNLFYIYSLTITLKKTINI